MFEKGVDLWRRWIRDVSFGFADQAVFSGANFILNVFLVRWLLPNEYGEFAVVFSIFLFLSGFQNALVLQPASVVGIAYHQKQLSNYLSILTFINIGLTCVLGFILLLVSLIMALNHYHLAFYFLGVGIATPFMLFFWWFRQICYIKTRPDLTLRASILYLVLLMGSIFILKNYNFLSVFSSLMAMAFSSLSSSLFFWHYLDIDKIRNSIGDDLLTVKHVLFEHWCYGRWVVGSAFVSWLSTVIYLPLIGFLVGFNQAGSFRAMQNLMLPLEKILSVFALLLVPWISKNRFLKGEGYVKKRLFMLFLINFFFASVYGIFLLIFGNLFVKLLYGQNYAASFIWLLPYFVVISIIGALVQVLGMGLKILERPNSIFWGESISTVLTLTVGLCLVVVFKLQGAILGLLISTIGIFLSLLYFLYKQFKRYENEKLQKNIYNKEVML